MRNGENGILVDFHRHDALAHSACAALLLNGDHRLLRTAAKAKAAQFSKDGGLETWLQAVGSFLPKPREVEVEWPMNSRVAEMEQLAPETAMTRLEPSIEGQLWPAGVAC
jgi:hypothetical protein